MSGAAGHLSHVIEDLNLTFADVRDILTQAMKGELKNVTEKCDGANVMLTSRDRHTYFARNLTDIRDGGVTVEQLVSRFEGPARRVFESGSRVISAAFGVWNDVDLESTFHAGQTWRSVEIVNSYEPNAITYDKSMIVFHDWPVLRSSEDNDEIVEFDGRAGTRAVARNVLSMNVLTNGLGWDVRAPVIVELSDVSKRHEQTLTDAMEKINASMRSHGLTWSSTLYDLVQAEMLPHVDKLNFPHAASYNLLNRCVGRPGVTLNHVKACLSTQGGKDLASLFVKRSGVIKAGALEPVRTAIYDVSRDVLAHVKSGLISDNDAEVASLQADLLAALATIESSGDEASIAEARRAMSALGGVEEIRSPVEGIVFTYKKKRYKLTGAFSEYRKVLALVKYGSNRHDQVLSDLHP